MDFVNSGKPLQGIYKVRDLKLILKMMVTLCILGGVIYLLTWDYLIYLSKSPNDYFLVKSNPKDGHIYVAYVNIVFITITLILLLRLRAVWSGIKINLNNKSVEIPGGNVSANNFIDVFKPSFLFQHFLRMKINLNEIRQIKQSSKSKVVRAIGGRLKTKSKYLLGLSGEFGAANVWFIDEGKRDEAYAAIRELNNMGDPFIRA